MASIDGKDVDSYLESLLKNTSSSVMLQDSDAEYNFLFYNPSTESPGSYMDDFFKQHNDTVVYSFENGTRYTSSNDAVFNFENFSYTSGKDLYERVIALVSTTPDSAPSSSSIVSAMDISSSSASLIPAIAGYPQLIIMHPQGDVSGYFLSGEEFSDVAVLSIPRFVDPPTIQPAIDFQRVVNEFLSKCH